MDDGSRRSCEAEPSMMHKGRILYWDSDVFLSYVGAHPDRINTITSLLQEIQNDGDAIVVTSVIAQVEVAYAAHEKTQRALDPQTEEAIDALWEDSSIVELIDLSYHIALMARSLIRQAMVNGWALRANDAIHLASAQWLPGVREFHTYDTRLKRFGSLIHCDVCEPHVLQPRLLP